MAPTESKPTKLQILGWAHGHGAIWHVLEGSPKEVANSELVEAWCFLQLALGRGAESMVSPEAWAKAKAAVGRPELDDLVRRSPASTSESNSGESSTGESSSGKSSGESSSGKSSGESSSGDSSTGAQSADLARVDILTPRGDSRRVGALFDPTRRRIALFDPELRLAQKDCHGELVWEDKNASFEALVEEFTKFADVYYATTGDATSDPNDPGPSDPDSRPSFVWPPRGKDHLQYVNMPASSSHPEYGPLILRLKGKPNTDIHVRAIYDKKNSARNDDPKPTFDVAGSKQPTVRGGTFTTKVQADDKGEARLTIELGAAGGDKVKLEVGADGKRWPESIRVVTSRKLRIVPVIPEGTKGLAITPAMRAPVARLLKEAFIEAEFAPPCEISPTHTKIASNPHYKLVTVGPDINEKFGRGRITRYFHRSAQDAPALYKAAYDALNPATEPYPSLFVLLGHTLYEDNNATEKCRERLTSPTGKWFQKSGLFPINPDGTSVLKEGKNSNWVTTEQTVPIKIADLDDFVEFDVPKNRLRLKLPSRKPNDPGRIVSEDEPVVVHVELKKLKNRAGIADASGASWVGVALKTLTPDPHRFAYTVVHELGHLMDQVPTSLKGLPGLENDVPDLEKFHPHYYNRSTCTHEGPHCNYGLPKKQADKNNYGPVVLAGYYGKCVMFGGIGEKTKVKQVLSFCKHCLKFFRAAKLTKVGR